MLAFWRKQSKWLTYGIFGAIVFVFIIWGFERRQLGETGSGTAAQVNGDLIPVRAFKQELNRRVTMYQQMLGGKFEGDIAKQMNLPARTLQDLISRQLAAQAAGKMGIVVADSEVRDRLMQVTFLQKDGKFSRENYDAMLRYYQMGASEFEDTLRHDASIEEAQEAFTKALVASPSQTALSEKLKAAKFNLEFLRLDGASLASAITVSDGEVASYLGAPENQKRLDEYLKANGDEFSTPARMRARHILISTQNGVSEAAAEEKAKKALAELKSSTFDKVAQKMSDDPGSKKKGGDLGWFSTGQMVPEFEKAASDLKIGQVSGIVKSSFGLHIIKLEGREAAKTSTPDQAKKLAAKKLAAQQKLEEQLNSLDKSYAADPAKEVAELQKKVPALKWEETGVFSLNDDKVPKLGETDDLQMAAFAITEKEPWGKHVFHEGGARYIIRHKAVPTSDLAKKETPKNKGPTPLDSVDTDNTGRNVFVAWIGQLGKKAKIVTNNNLLQQQGEPE